MQMYLQLDHTYTKGQFSNFRFQIQISDFIFQIAKKPCSAIQIFAAVRGGENRPGVKEKRPTASPATHSQKTWQCLCAVCLTRSVPKLSCWAPPLRPRAASTQQPTTCGPALFSRPSTGVTCSTLMSGGYAASKARENPFCG